MPDTVVHQAFLKLCEMSIDNLYEFETLEKLLEGQNFITKQEILDRAKALLERTITLLDGDEKTAPKTTH